MADRYGRQELPAPVPLQTGYPSTSSPGDECLSYLGEFLKTVMEFNCGNLWESLAPNIPIVKRIVCDAPESDMNEQWLPALYLYRPGRETREVIETFEQVADDYRFQRGRIAVRWVMPTAPQEHRRVRDQIIDTLRKAIDNACNIGRHKAWIVPGEDDPAAPNYDPKAATQGSSLLINTGCSVIELDHASVGTYEHKMKPPALARFYPEMKLSFIVEEQSVYDLELAGEPNLENKVQFQSPDQGTGLGPFILGDAIYD